MASARFGGKPPFYAVHITSFRAPERAANDATRLSEVTGYPADYIDCIIATEGKNTGTWYRVIVGHFNDPETAQRAARSFREKGISDYAKVYRISGP
jgi:hypothetical protein